MNALLGQVAAVEGVVCAGACADGCADGSAVAWREGSAGRIGRLAADCGPSELPTSLSASEISS